MDTMLEHLIYGQPIASDQAAKAPDVLALSRGLQPSIGPQIHEIVALQPLPLTDVRSSQSMALIQRNPSAVISADATDFVLARAHYQGDDQTSPIFEYIFLTDAILDNLGGDLQPLLSFFETPIARYKGIHAPLARLEVPTSITWTLDKQVALLKPLLDDMMAGDMRLLLSLLGAVLADDGLDLVGFPLDNNQRLSLVRGLMTLLPTVARPHLTFTLYSDQRDHLPRLSFRPDQAAVPNRQRITWKTTEQADTFIEHPYTAHLLNLWEDDMIGLLQHIHNLDRLAAPLMRDETLGVGLGKLVERHQRDLAIMRRDQLVSTQEMLSVLHSDTPPDGKLRLQYLEQLLRRALDERDSEAATHVTQEIDADNSVANNLDALLHEALETQPDAVYVLARTRLSDGLDEHWLERLHSAGRRSLQMAIEQSDPDILASWLTLVAREPKRYKMGEILREGIIAARNRAYNSPELAEQLLTIAVKRQPDLLPSLLNDPHILATLSDKQAASLRDYDPQAIEGLADETRELFLLALQNALNQEQPCISTNAIRRLWVIHTSQQTNTIAPQYRPLAIIERIARDDNNALLDGTLATLLSLMLADQHDDLFYEVAELLAVRAALMSILVQALEESGRNTDDILTILNNLLTGEIITPQMAVDSYTTLLTNRNWDDNSQPLIEQLARVMSQYPDTQATSVAMWNIVEMSEMLKNEQMLRVAVRRLLFDLRDTVSEEQLVEKLIRLRKAAQWNNAGRSNIMRWWREFTRTCSSTQLQKLERAMAGKRTLDDARSVVQTTIALRRMIGQRTLLEFANAINTTYNILQAVADGFDPENKTAITVDSATIRGEIDARASDLAPDERHILATNLKELAQVITSMAENRSRPILRSDGTIERQLVTGEQHPQSAIDVMRWLSGYLDGMQENDDQD